MRKMMRMQLMKIKKCEEVTISCEYYEGCALVTMIWIMFIFPLFDIHMFLIINIHTCNCFFFLSLNFNVFVFDRQTKKTILNS